MADNQKTQIPRVPVRTPMFDENGHLHRTWIIFFERLGKASSTTIIGGPGNHVIGWDLQDTTPGLDVADPVIPVQAGVIAACLIRVKYYDESNPLEIDIRNLSAEGEPSIFGETRPVIPADSDSREVYVFDTLFAADPLVVNVHDDLVIDVVQGGAWEAAVYLAYAEAAEEEPEP